VDVKKVDLIEENRIVITKARKGRGEKMEDQK
jgi:hypothetical protein